MTPDQIQQLAALLLEYTNLLWRSETEEVGLEIHSQEIKIQVFVSRLLEDERNEGRARFFVTYPWWLYRTSGVNVPDFIVDTLLEFAKKNEKDDFLFAAGSAGVPLEDREILWEGTRRRLGL